jgi:hypothetical protein
MKNPEEESLEINTWDEYPQSDKSGTRNPEGSTREANHTVLKKNKGQEPGPGPELGKRRKIPEWLHWELRLQTGDWKLERGNAQFCSVFPGGTRRTDTQ